MTLEIIPPPVFFDFAADPLPEVLPRPFDVVFFCDDELARADLTPLLFEFFAPPDAVRLPAAPLFVPVEDFDPPEFDAVVERAVELLVAAFVEVPADLEAPVLLADELFVPALFLDPPVDAVPDLFPPWLDLDDDFDPESDFFAPPFDAVDLDELFAVAISCISIG